jgi:DNA-binding NarL/FixJ family response regulator
MENKTVMILLADDHEIVRRGLRNLLEINPLWKICGEASDWDEAYTLIMDLKPDIALLDISMPSDGDISVLVSKVTRYTKVLIFTMHDLEEPVRNLLSAGIQGYVLKSDADKFLVSAIEALLDGKSFFSPRISETILRGFMKSGLPQPAADRCGPPLTARELEVVKLLASGRSNKEIATMFSRSVKTIETHRRAIMRKLGARSVIDLVHYAIRNKIVEPIR